MDFFSLAYILFVLIALIFYYRLPERFQWVVLLIANISFYLICGKWNIIFILITSLSVWLGGRKLSDLSAQHKVLKKNKELTKEDKKALKNRFQNKKRLVLWLVLILNLGILALIKYFKIFTPVTGLLLPLGISFYTFQAIGYLVDVYGDKYQAEKNYFRFLLFVSFFPQLIQGPINRYDKLGEQLKRAHKIDGERVKKALMLILYGLMKKYAIANMLVDSIEAVISSPVDVVPGALIAFAILMYSAQQYADFSGGIDIVLGVALLFDLEMMPNFRQPYFATSLGDFWRRWHISLGAFMRDYVFYPFALLKPMQKFGKWCSKHFGNHFGRVLPAGIANILVFFLVGLWHGAESHYIWWGLYNGIVIALSDLLEPAFSKVFSALHIKSDSKGVHVFRIIRTFIIVNIGWYFDRIEDFGQCIASLARTAFHFNLVEFMWSFGNVLLNPNAADSSYVLGGMALATISCIIVFVISVLFENGVDVFGSASSRKTKTHETGGATGAITKVERVDDSVDLRRIFLSLLFIFLIFISFVFMTSTGGFLYANF